MHPAILANTVKLIFAALGPFSWSGSQMLGQLPIEQVPPDIVFEKVGIDYVGPVYTKYGSTRKPTIVKIYVCFSISESCSPRISV